MPYSYFKDLFPTVLLLVGVVALIGAAYDLGSQLVLRRWGESRVGVVSGVARTDEGMRRYRGPIDVTVDAGSVDSRVVKVSGEDVDLWALNDQVKILVPRGYWVSLGLNARLDSGEPSYFVSAILSAVGVMLIGASVGALFVAPKVLVVFGLTLVSGVFLGLGLYRSVVNSIEQPSGYVETEARVDEILVSKYKQTRAKSDPRGSDYTVTEYFARVRYSDQNNLEKRYVISASNLKASGQQTIKVSYHPITGHVFLGGIETVPAEQNASKLVLLVFGIGGLILAYAMYRSQS